MLVAIFVAIVKNKDEEIIVGAGNNRRLVEIQRDSFLSREDHIDWEGQIQEFRFEIEWVKDYNGKPMEMWVLEPEDEEEKSDKDKDKDKEKKK